MLYQTSAMFSSEAKLSALSKQLSVMSYCWAKKQQSPRLVNSSALYTPIWRRRLEEKDDEKAAIIVDKLYLSRKDYGMLECHVWRKHLKSSTFRTVFLGTILLFQCNNYVPQKTLKHCLVLWGGVKKWLSRPSAGQLDKVRVSCGARAKHRQDIVSFDHLKHLYKSILSCALVTWRNNCTIVGKHVKITSCTVYKRV